MIPEHDRSRAADAWNAMADAYDAYVGTREDYYRTQVMGPGLLAACGPVRGVRVLDLGCGQGYFTRLLAQEGATVVGVDISERLIHHAVRRERLNPLGIRYDVLDAADIAAQWQPASFDMVASCIALQDMMDPHRVLSSVGTVLTPEGRAVFLVEHPTNTTAAREWDRDPTGQKVMLRIDRYFETQLRAVTWTFRDPTGAAVGTFQFPSWSRTLEQWSELFSATGFLVARLAEPRPTTTQVAQYPELDDCFRIPYFLIFDLVRSNHRR